MPKKLEMSDKIIIEFSLYLILGHGCLLEAELTVKNVTVT